MRFQHKHFVTQSNNIQPWQQLSLYESIRPKYDCSKINRYGRQHIWLTTQSNWIGVATEGKSYIRLVANGRRTESQKNMNPINYIVINNIPEIIWIGLQKVSYDLLLTSDTTASLLILRCRAICIHFSSIFAWILYELVSGKRNVNPFFASIR